MMGNGLLSFLRKFSARVGPGGLYLGKIHHTGKAGKAVERRLQMEAIQ
jgi:hypothetical protein